jgi:hypothetical protein
MKNRRRPESGFALLFVFAMAATVAIMLYMEIPRVAFEAQRDKEQLLIDRGEQYTRAVTLFVRKFNRFPADIDALQSTQNLRFLRHKYVDPMTGKDEWRIVHVGPGGVFTDSLVYNKKKAGSDGFGAQNFITELQQTGGNEVSGNGLGLNLAGRQRPSDQAGAPGDPNNLNQTPQFDANGQPVTPVNPAVQVLPNGQIVPVQQPNQPGAAGQFPPGANGFSNLPPGVQLPQPNNFQPGTFPGQPAQNSQAPGTQPPTNAAGLINQILTTPRPGGLNGLGGIQQGLQSATVDQNGNPLPPQGGQNGAGQSISTLAGPGSSTATTQTGTASQTIGGGMAGVASKYEQEGIKIYKEQKPYNKWEFVYDITKDPARTGGAQAPATPAPSGAAPGAAGAVGAGAPGAFGQTGTTGQTGATPPVAPATTPQQ